MPKATYRKKTHSLAFKSQSNYKISSKPLTVEQFETVSMIVLPAVDRHILVIGSSVDSYLIAVC